MFNKITELIKKINKEEKEKLKEYAKHIEICGEKRGSYSKTDKSATLDVKQYASDMDCFVPLMEKFMKFTMFEKETRHIRGNQNMY